MTALTPSAIAENCDDTAYHPLGGSPLLQSCSGGPGYSDNTGIKCESDIEISGTVIIYDCDETVCQSENCYKSAQVYKIYGGIWIWYRASCPGVSNSQPYDPNYDNAWCSYGLAVMNYHVMLYLENKEVDKPGVCYIASGGWRCYHIYP